MIEKFEFEPGKLYKVRSPKIIVYDAVLEPPPDGKFLFYGEKVLFLHNDKDYLPVDTDAERCYFLYLSRVVTFTMYNCRPGDTSIHFELL